MASGRRAPDLRRAGGAGEPAGAPPEAPGRRAGGAGGCVRRALGGDGGRPARRPQGRRRLRAARPDRTRRSGWAWCSADSGVAVLLTEERLLAGLPPHGARVICLDRDREAIAAESSRVPGALASEENLAYVIYTSGSTGRPKGVQLPHRAVVNFLRSMAERPGLRAADVVPALTTLSFDIAGLEIYLPLTVGGRIEVVSRDEAADGALLAERLAKSGATVVQATPATWRLLIDSGWRGRSRPEGPVRRRGAAAGPRRGAAGRAASSCGTSTAPPRRRSGRRPARSPTATGRSRSARRSPTPSCTWWIAASARCRSAWRESCGSAARGWPAAICAGRS